MEPNELRAWEEKCIQEEPPQCTAACPIHVDARLFVRQAMTTSRAGVFAGGAGQADGRRSPIAAVLEGRRAATSIDRFVTNVSMESGREKEGPHPTRLYTSLAGIAPLPRLAPADPDQGHTPGEALLEAGRCLQCQCLECVKVCAYLERFKGYPKKYAREIYNNERVVPGGVHRANLLVNSCSNCGLCATVCPNDFHMGELCHDARLSMVGRGKMPPAAHEFALQDMEFSASDKFALARHEPGLTESRYLFFPSCQLAGSSPAQVAQAYRYLRQQLTGGVGLILNCCGAPAFWAGRDDLYYAAADNLRAQWHSLGEPTMIVACSSCTSIFWEQLPEVPLVSLWEVLEQTGLPDKTAATGQVAVVDPCSSRLDPTAQGSVRRLLERLGVAVEELPLHGDKPECCGFGGLMANANPALAREVVARRLGAGDSEYLAYCAMCREQFAAAGKRVTHLIDLIFPGEMRDDPASRPATGWSLRHENRARLKETLLRELWGEGSGTVAGYERIRVEIPPAVLERMEARRILVADVQRVIEHAERTGSRLRNRESGLCRAYYRPHRVTFWVDYRRQGDGFIIENAYCHRMAIIRSNCD